MENITEHMPSNLSNEELLLVQALLDRKTSQTVKTFVCKVREILRLGLCSPYRALHRSSELSNKCTRSKSRYIPY